jgi:transcription termination factor Rho
VINGILELMDRGGGHLRRREAGYAPEAGDLRVDDRLIRALGLRTGDEIVGELGDGAAVPEPGPAAEADGERGGRSRRGRSRNRRRRGGGRGESPRGGGGGGPALARVVSVNGRTPEELGERRQWDRLAAVHPNEQLRLECPLVRRGQPDYTTRVIDLLCPLGKGQRALVVAPAKAGKTMVLQAIAEGILTNNPTATVFILLVDERPEEIFEMEAAGFGEVVASSFDHPPARHVACAELLLERARRRVELGEDVVLIVDSITRLARAYNAVVKGTGRTLSGGLDAQSLERPKRFLGSARKVDPSQGGGSLTIIATALIDTGSRMDQLIFEEFKGTGNSELVLSRDLADRRVFPAIDIVASGTRREELLLSEEALGVARQIRQRIGRQTPLAAMNDLLVDLKRSRSNAELIAQLAGR